MAGSGRGALKKQPANTALLNRRFIGSSAAFGRPYAETAADLGFPRGLSDLEVSVEPSAKGSMPGGEMTGQVREDAAEALAAE
jgi:hypothetical protein